MSNDRLIAQHFYQLWLDNNLTSAQIDRNWLQTTLEFIAKARQELLFQAFVASIDEKIVASGRVEGEFLSLAPLC